MMSASCCHLAGLSCEEDAMRQEHAYWGIGACTIGRQGDPQEEQPPNVGHIVGVGLVTNLPVHREDEERSQCLLGYPRACSKYAVFCKNEEWRTQAQLQV